MLLDSRNEHWTGPIAKAREMSTCLGTALIPYAKRKRLISYLYTLDECSELDIRAVQFLCGRCTGYDLFERFTETCILN